MSAPIRAAVLLPAPDYPEAFGWAFDNQAAALGDAGFAIEARRWTDLDVEREVDVVLPLVAWGYHRRLEEWLALLDRLESKRTRVLNPVPLLRWNSDKAYLAELAANGIATIPTLTVDAIDEATLADARARLGSEEVVIKPPVSAGADGTFRLGPGDAVPDSVSGRTMLVQPFERTILSEGELALLLFNGDPSHAVVKRARPGDYRVQPHFGGTEEQVEPPSAAIALACQALAAAPARAAYARVDLVADGAGGWRVMELELIEPALFLHRAVDSARRFGAAMRAAAEEILAQG